MVGVKDKSKMVLQEDPISQEKRFLEMRKNAKIEKAAKSISQISLEVDRLAGQVCPFQPFVVTLFYGSRQICYFLGLICELTNFENSN